ncbi:MAG: GNAT family N-acetyltransferase [Bacilli bacterium]
MREVIIHTPRLVLREFVSADWEAVHRYAALDDVCRYQPWGPNTETATRDFVQEAMHAAGQTPRRRYAFAVVGPDSGLLLGAIELHVRGQHGDTGEIGYVLHPEHWGRGFAQEAAQGILRFAFEELAMHRVSATCDSRNHASASVLRRIGMVQEGRAREERNIRDGWRDTLMFAVLASEWRSDLRIGRQRDRTVDHPRLLIRERTDEDLEGVRDVDLLTWAPANSPAPEPPEPLGEYRRYRQHWRGLVAVLDGRVCGYAGVNTPSLPSQRHVLTLDLAVHPEHQRRGIATALLRAVEEEARAQGKIKIALRVLSSNPGAVSLYSRLGYTEEGRLRKEFFLKGVYVDDLLMCKFL